MLVTDVPNGAAIEWDGETWIVKDVRRHAMTEHDGTVWLILDGWKDAGRGDPPKIPLDTIVDVCATFT